MIPPRCVVTDLRDVVTAAAATTSQEKRSYAKGAKIIIQGQKIVQRGQKPIKGQTVPAELYIVLSSLGKIWGWQKHSMDCEIL